MPVTVRKQPGFEQDLERQFAAHRADLADRLVATTMRHVLKVTPVEDGHAHEAWSQAMLDVMVQMPVDRQTSAVLSGETRGSGNPLAAHGQPGLKDMRGREVAGRGGFGGFTDTDGRTTVELHNELLFVGLMEEGGTLVPIQPGGGKVRDGSQDSRGRYGFLHPRTAKGRGMLAWEEGGRRVKAPIRMLRARHIVAGGLSRAKRSAGRYGTVTEPGE